MIQRLISPHALGGVLVSITVAGTGACIWMYISTHAKMRRSAYFKIAVEALLDSDDATLALGHPIKIGNVDLGDSHTNFVTPEVCNIVIPVKGSQDAGNLYVLASRNPAAEKRTWQLDRLELELAKANSVMTIVSSVD